MATASDPEEPPASDRVEVAGLGIQEQSLLSLITSEPVNIDTLIAASGLNAQEVLNGLLVLELRGLIRQMPGKHFILKESHN